MRRVAKRTANTQEEKACPRMNLPSRKTKDSYFPRKGFSVRMGKTQTNLGNAYYSLPIGESCRQFAEGHRGLPGSPAGLHRGGFPTDWAGAIPPSAVSGRNAISPTYPLTEPAVRPATKCRCRKKKTRMTGIDTRTELAIRSP